MCTVRVCASAKGCLFSIYEDPLLKKMLHLNERCFSSQILYHSNIKYAVIYKQYKCFSFFWLEDFSYSVWREGRGAQEATG